MASILGDILSYNCLTNGGILSPEKVTMSARRNRQKISTTIAPENAAYLRSLLKRGKASTLSEAVDSSIALARRADNRRRLEAATAAYYASLSGEALEEERQLEEALGYEASQVDFDGE
jgi:hypothetical protein